MSELVLEKSKWLPDGWDKTTLDDISMIILGQSPPSSTYNKMKKGLPFFQGKAEFGKIYPEVKVWCDSPTKIAEKDDILISVRAPVGPTNICSERSGIGRGLAAIRVLGGMQNLFILNYLRSIENIIRGKGTGTTFNAITGPKLRSIEIKLPPLNEQKRIVLKIEELFSKIDTNLHLLNYSKKLLRQQQKSLVKYALDGDFTQEWRKKFKILSKRIKKDLESVTTSSRNGFTGRPSDTPPGTPRLGIVSITGSSSLYVDEEAHKFIEIPQNKIKNYLVMENDILVCRQNGNKQFVGKFAVFKGKINPIIFSDSLIRFRINKKEIFPEYLVIFMNSGKGRKLIEPYCSTTAGNYSINGTNLKKIVIDIPPIEEQKIIVSKIEEGVLLIQNSDKWISNNIVKFEQIKKIVLKLAFEGNLIPQDPNDEPASVLLEKIKKEKEQLIQQNPRRKKKNVK